MGLPRSWAGAFTISPWCCQVRLGARHRIAVTNAVVISLLSGRTCHCMWRNCHHLLQGRGSVRNMFDLPSWLIHAASTLVIRTPPGLVVCAL